MYHIDDGIVSYRLPYCSITWLNCIIYNIIDCEKYQWTIQLGHVSVEKSVAIRDTGEA